jgi:hypothetical protein
MRIDRFRELSRRPVVLSRNEPHPSFCAISIKCDMLEKNKQIERVEDNKNTTTYAVFACTTRHQSIVGHREWS